MPLAVVDFAPAGVGFVGRCLVGAAGDDGFLVVRPLRGEGVALCIFLYSRDPVVGLPPDFPIEVWRITLFNSVMGTQSGFFFIVLASIFAARAVKRFLRLRQLWGEKDPARL